MGYGSAPFAIGTSQTLFRMILNKKKDENKFGGYNSLSYLSILNKSN